MSVDDRAVSVTVNYVLLVGITALLAAGLMLGTAGFVTDQQERAVRTGLDALGNRVASDLTTADGLADSLGGDGSVRFETDLPERVGGTTYHVVVDPQGVDGSYHEYALVLTSTDPEVTVTVPVRTRRPVSADPLDGGPVVVSATPTGLEVDDA